jgi:CBS domain-containing protein
MAILKVKDAMQPVPPALPSNLPLDQVVARFTNQGQGHVALPVVDRAGRYEGTLTMGALEHALQGNENPLAHELARDVAALKEDESLEDALDTLLGSDGSGSPVFAPDERTLVGWLTHQDVLRLYQQRVTRPARPRGIWDAWDA